jgi:hypothetical protein
MRYRTAGEAVAKGLRWVAVLALAGAPSAASA